jgi:hypothetical protein
MSQDHEIDQPNKSKSTGPRTPAGKAISSRNSTKHGLASGQLIIPGEDPAAFEAMLADFEDDYQPANAIESALVHDLAKFRWLTDRALRLQSEAFTNEAPMIPFNLGVLMRYQNTNHRAFHATLKALQTIQKERKKRENKFVSSDGEWDAEDDGPELTFGLSGEPVGPNTIVYDPINGWHKPKKSA